MRRKSQRAIPTLNKLIGSSRRYLEKFIQCEPIVTNGKKVGFSDKHLHVYSNKMIQCGSLLKLPESDERAKPEENKKLSNFYNFSLCFMSKKVKSKKHFDSSKTITSNFMVRQLKFDEQEIDKEISQNFQTSALLCSDRVEFDVLSKFYDNLFYFETERSFQMYREKYQITHNFSIVQQLIRNLSELEIESLLYNSTSNRKLIRYESVLSGEHQQKLESLKEFSLTDNKYNSIKTLEKNKLISSKKLGIRKQKTYELSKQNRRVMEAVSLRNKIEEKKDDFSSKSIDRETPDIPTKRLILVDNIESYKKYSKTTMKKHRSTKHHVYPRKGKEKTFKIFLLKKNNGDQFQDISLVETRETSNLVPPETDQRINTPKFGKKKNLFSKTNYLKKTLDSEGHAHSQNLKPKNQIGTSNLEYLRKENGMNIFKYKQ